MFEGVLNMHWKHLWMTHIEAVARRCYVKKVFLEILQNSQENSLLLSKRDSGTGVFLWILRNFYEQLFL